MSKTTMLTLLQNAVRGISELRIVKEQGDQLNVHSNQTLTYDQYLPLLKSAAQSYDSKFQRHKMNKGSFLVAPSTSNKLTMLLLALCIDL